MDHVVLAYEYLRKLYYSDRILKKIINPSMTVSRLDVLYRKILLTKFFTKGWGPPETLQRLFEYRKVISNRDLCYKLVSTFYPISIINKEIRSDCRILEGKFRSPFSQLLPEIVSPEIQDAFFQMILPLEWPSDNYKPICIHLAGTGDHYFWRRRNIMAKPLLKAGIGSIILENPYYGLRKPKAQIRSSLHYVSDVFVMGGSLILECLTLLNMCERLGFGPLGVSGISMGGHMASLAASNWPKPIVLVPCLSWSTASSVFTEGVMSDSIDWDMLQDHYLTNPYYCDTLSKHCKIVDNPLESSLRKIPGYVFNTSDDTFKDNLRHITPFDVLSLMSSQCRDLGCIKDSAEYPYGTTKRTAEMKKRCREAVLFMRGVMDECTHLANFSVPVDTSLIISVCAECDGYVPTEGVASLEELWPGATVRRTPTGHVGAYIWHLNLFRESIIEAFDRAKKILPPPSASKYEI